MREFIRSGAMTVVLASQLLTGVVTAVHADEYSRDEYSRDEYSRDDYESPRNADGTYSRDVDSSPAPTGSNWGQTMLEAYQDSMNQSNARDAEARAGIEDAVRRGTEEREAREAQERMQRAAAEEEARYAREQAAAQERARAEAAAQAQYERERAATAERERVAAAERQREEAASYQARNNDASSRSDSKPQLQSVLEAIVACTRPDAEGRFECDTPVEVNLRGGPNNGIEAWRTPDSMITSLDSCTAPRRLPSATHIVWGCGFGATGNSNSMDRSAGVDAKGRQTFYCHPLETGCTNTAP